MILTKEEIQYIRNSGIVSEFDKFKETMISDNYKLKRDCIAAIRNIVRINYDVAIDLLPELLFDLSDKAMTIRRHTLRTLLEISNYYKYKPEEMKEIQKLFSNQKENIYNIELAKKILENIEIIAKIQIEGNCIYDKREIEIEKSEINMESLEQSKILYTEDENKLDLFTIKAKELIDLYTSYIRLSCNWEDINSNRNMEIILKRLGLNGNRKRTLQSVGDEYGLTRERIRQIEYRVFKKIKSLVKTSQTYKVNFMEILSFIKQTDSDDYSNSEFLTFIYYGMNEIISLRCIWIILSTMFVEEELVGFFAKYKEEVIEIHQFKKNKIKIDKYDNWLSENITWPGKRGVVTVEQFTKLMPLRNVDRESMGDWGIVYSEKTGVHIEFESGIENSFIARCECSSLIVNYKPQALKIGYKIDSQYHSYYPDFCFLTTNNEMVVVECKPMILMTEYKNLCKFRSLHNYCKKFGFGYIILDASKRTFSRILKHNVNNLFAEEYMKKIQEQKVIGWSVTKSLLKKYECRNIDLYALIVKEKLIMEFQPFKVQLSINKSI